jgi:hypothetical protein
MVRRGKEGKRLGRLLAPNLASSPALRPWPRVGTPQDGCPRGDEVVGTGYILVPLHAVDAPDYLGDLACLADLGLDEHIRAEQFPR